MFNVNTAELILAAYANEGPVTGAHLKIRETQLDIGNVGRDGSPGDVVVQNVWISVDPYLRQLMKETNDGLYFQSFELNQVCLAIILNIFLPTVCISTVATSFLLLLVQVIRSGSVGKVVASANPEFEVGDIVFGFFEVSEYVIVQGGVLRKIDRNEL